MEEHIFYKDENVTVSNARLDLEGELYAISGINSVKLTMQRRRLSYILLIIGILGVVIGFTIMNTGITSVGGIFLILVALNWFFQNIEHSLTIQMASGEVKEYTNSDELYLEKIFQAISDAIVFRG